MMKPWTRWSRAALLPALLAGLSACLPVRTTNLEGAVRGGIRRIDDRGEFTSRFGNADAATTDGRFALYALDKEAEWYLLGSDAPVASAIVGQTQVLVEFDAANRTQSADFRHCDEHSKETFCLSPPEDRLWAMVESRYGDEMATELRFRESRQAAAAAAIHDAATSGQLSELERLLGQGGSATTEVEGIALIHRAALAGQTDVVAFLIDRGVFVDALSARASETPLHLAAASGAMDTVVWLLAHGAMIDALDAAGSTPLRRAVENAQPAVALQLLGAGANLDADDDPDVIVVLAAALGDVDLLTALLDQGASPDARDAPLGGRPALYRAVQQGHVDVVTLLLARGASLSAGLNAYDPLHAAIDANDADMVVLLLEHGADPNRRVRISGVGRVTPRERAQQQGADAIDALLEAYGGRI